MFMRLVYDEQLAQAAYLIGCPATGEAIVFDPERDVDRYIALAKANGLRIVGAADTHIHADFLSGTRELAATHGAHAYLSGEGGADWTPKWIGNSVKHTLLRHGDSFKIGNIEFTALHTPGHTPEHLCFTVTDLPSTPKEPVALISGDFLFVGDLGRPDLLETAAGVRDTAEPGARALHRSLAVLHALPDYCQVWPGHGSGSACGKALGAVPQSTIGYEKRHNPALALAGDPGAFVRMILSGQPEPPAYFARMKRENVAGPAVLGSLPRPQRLSAEQLRAARNDSGATIIDTRPWDAYRAGHAPGSLSIQPGKNFITLAGSFVDPSQLVTLIVEPALLDECVRGLVRVGIDRVTGWIAPADAAPAATEKVAQVSPEQARQMLASGTHAVLDVRRADEFVAGHLPGATHVPHVQLAKRLNEVPRGKPLLVNCRSGVRSSWATALLKKHGFDATNLQGGFLAWEAAGGEVEK